MLPFTVDVQPNGYTGIYDHFVAFYYVVCNVSINKLDLDKTVYVQINCNKVFGQTLVNI